MNANTIITPEMSLEQKLEAIDKAMAEFEAKHKTSNPDAPYDPILDLMCGDACQ